MAQIGSSQIVSASQSLLPGRTPESIALARQNAPIRSSLKESPTQRDAIELAEFNCVIYGLTD